MELSLSADRQSLSLKSSLFDALELIQRKAVLALQILELAKVCLLSTVSFLLPSYDSTRVLLMGFRIESRTALSFMSLSVSLQQ